jgi:hypothetical protein
VRDSIVVALTLAAYEATAQHESNSKTHEASSFRKAVGVRGVLVEILDYV